MMKHLLSFLLILCMAASLAGTASANAEALTLSEMEAFAAALKERALTSELLNDPADEDALSEDGYAMIYDFAALYCDQPAMTAETKLSAAMIRDEETAALRGVHLNAYYPDVIAAFRNDNPSLDGSRSGALLYLDGDAETGFVYGLALRDGQRLQSVEYGAVAPTEGGFTRAALTFSIDMNLVSGIRLEGLTEITDAEAAASLMGELQTLGTERGYTEFPVSWTGTDLAVFGEEDLTFSGISFLELQPDSFGSLAEDVLMSNDEDGWLRVVNTEDYSATFLCDENGENARIAYLELTSDSVDGPRGVRLGDSFGMDFNRFRNGEGEVAADGLSEMLYGSEGTAPWGKAFYADSDGMALRYVTAAQGREVELYLHYTGTELTEIRLSAR